MSGRYFIARRPTSPSRAAMDDRVAGLLWDRSLALAGLADDLPGISRESARPAAN
jgi:hypothetical protein